MMSTSVSKTTKAEALKILKGFREIVINEMLFHGLYISQEVENEDLKAQGAICGGHQMCAVGSLWVASGIKPHKCLYGTMEIDSARPNVREDFLSSRPALRIAYEVMNEVSAQYAEDNDFEVEDYNDYDYLGAMEILFEVGFSENLGPSEDGLATQEERGIMLSLIEAAEDKIHALPLEES